MDATVVTEALASVITAAQASEHLIFDHFKLIPIHFARSSQEIQRNSMEFNEFPYEMSFDLKSLAA